MFSVASKSSSVSPGNPTMKSPRNGDVGAGGAHLVQICEIGFGRVAAVHRLEDAVAARLHRQVQIGHQLVDLAMGGNQLVGHVGRVAGRVADPLEPIELRQVRGSGRRGRGLRRPTHSRSGRAARSRARRRRPASAPRRRCRPRAARSRRRGCRGRRNRCRICRSLPGRSGKRWGWRGGAPGSASNLLIAGMSVSTGRPPRAASATISGRR